MMNEDRKLIEAYVSEEGTSLDRAYRAEQAREAVKKLLWEYDVLHKELDIEIENRWRRDELD